MLSLPVIILTVPIMMVLAYKLRSYKTAGIIAYYVPFRDTIPFLFKIDGDG